MGKTLVFVCDAGMGSSAMGASVLKKKAKKEKIDVKITNKSVRNVTDDYNYVVTQEKFEKLVKEKCVSAERVFLVKNFMDNKAYDAIIETIK